MNACDRVTFAHSISYPEDFIPGIVRYFDEVMWLYSIAAELDYSNIAVNNVDQTTCFNIQFMTEYQMGKLQQVISDSNGIVSIYGRNFSISLNKITDTSMNVSVKQCA